MDRPRGVGLPWYAPEHYEALRAGLADGGKLLPEYETWRNATEQMKREVQHGGVEVMRVPIEPEAFAAWCEESGLPRDAAARA